MKKVAILQSNYIPWKGYFDLIAAVDEFIIFDQMQYTKRDWRNRNKIKTPQGELWLTIPVKVKGRYYQTISETMIDGNDWIDVHWQSLHQCYKRAPFFLEIASWLEPLYETLKNASLSDTNRKFIEAICAYLQIDTKISNSSDYVLIDGKSERLADLCIQVEGTEYVSGPSAKNYIDPDVFSASGLTLSWFDYSNYPSYPQLWGGFVHEVSILDLLFNCGKDAPNYMRYVAK